MLMDEVKWKKKVTLLMQCKSNRRAWAKIRLSDSECKLSQRASSSFHTSNGSYPETTLMPACTVCQGARGDTKIEDDRKMSDTPSKCSRTKYTKYCSFIKCYKYMIPKWCRSNGTKGPIGIWKIWYCQGTFHLFYQWGPSVIHLLSDQTSQLTSMSSHVANFRAYFLNLFSEGK